MSRRFDPRRFAALLTKESLQIMRDPSTLLIAFVLPLMLLFLFGYGVNLDTGRTRIGLAVQDNSAAASGLAGAFASSPYFTVSSAGGMPRLKADMVAGRIRGIVVIPQGFGRDALAGGGDIQVITDGSIPNTASFIAAYAEGVRANWAAGRASEAGRRIEPAIAIASRFWFNPELASRFFLVPGAIAIVMTMIGTLLTALVIAREWERGTMEAIMATPVGMIEFLATKVIPYFVLGLGSMTVCTVIAVTVFGVPLRGSPVGLLAIASAFLVPALGQGLLISAVFKNQFVASQVALLTAFLPAMELSGFLFEISSMPKPIQWLTYLVPARYLIPPLQTVFVVGDLWGLFARDIAVMLLFGLVFFTLALRATHAGGMIGGRLGAIIVKEMWAVLRDPRARITLIVPPILQLVLFGLATTLEVKNVDIGVLNRDGGAYSRELIARVAGSPNVRRIVPLTSEAQMADAVDNRRVIAALQFGPQFSADVAARRPAAVLAVFDGRRSNAAQIVSGYLSQIAGGMGADLRPSAATSSSGAVIVNHWFNPNLDYLWFTMPALVVIISAISSMSVVAQSVARERELGTFDQLMVSPLRVSEILMGKMTPPLIIGLFNASLYLLVIPTVFGVPLTGSVLIFYVALIFYLLALIGVGMFVSTLSQTQQQAFLGMFLVTVPAILLSGFASPVDNMPRWLQILAEANPPKHFLIIVEGIFLKAMPAAEVLKHTWPLAMIAAVTLSASALLFRSRME